MKNIEKYLKTCRQYCTNVENVENYDKVIKNPELIWVLHHRKEIENGHTIYTHDQLLELNLYYHRPANELIFLTYNEHKKLHMNTVEEKEKQRLAHVNLQKGDKNPFYGKKHTNETKIKISNAAKKRIGNKNPFYGKEHSEKTKDLISNGLKGKFAGKNNPNYKKGKWYKKYNMTQQEICDMLNLTAAQVQYLEIKNRLEDKIKESV